MAGRLGSGGSGSDLGLSCNLPRRLTDLDPGAIISLFLKYGESPSRNATHIPVTWMSLFTSSSMACVVRSGFCSSSMESCSPENGRETAV
jgi:hypothetical protein